MSVRDRPTNLRMTLLDFTEKPMTTKPNYVARRPLIATVALLVGGGAYAAHFTSPSHSEALAAPAPPAVQVMVRTLAMLYIAYLKTRC